MQTSRLNPGDRIHCNVKGVKFVATYEQKCPGNLHKITPDQDHYTWRFVSSRQIEERLERQGRLAA